jgi:predicted house-cleaning NTP pyrophosphatase (Maf/HAM1 superfamily)
VRESETLEEGFAEFLASERKVVRRACQLHAEQVAWEAEIPDLVLGADRVECCRDVVRVANDAAVVYVRAYENLLGCVDVQTGVH